MKVKLKFVMDEQIEVDERTVIGGLLAVGTAAGLYFNVITPEHAEAMAVGVLSGWRMNKRKAVS